MSRVIYIRVFCNSRDEIIQKISDIEAVEKYIVRVKEPSHRGLANRRLIEILAKYFKIPQSKVLILAGKKDKNKKILLLD